MIVSERQSNASLFMGTGFSVKSREWFSVADITTNWALAYTTFVQQGTLSKDIDILMSHFPRTKRAGESLEELDCVLLERALSRMTQAGWLETKDKAWFGATGHKLTALGRSVVLEQLTDSEGRVTLSNPVLTKENVTDTTAH